MDRETKACRDLTTGQKLLCYSLLLPFKLPSPSHHCPPPLAKFGWTVTFIEDSVLKTEFSGYISIDTFMGAIHLMFVFKIIGSSTSDVSSMWLSG